MQSILLIPMRFIFRSDASREIGSGHVMRSSVLAEEAISRGFECIFVGVISDLDWVSERIAKLGFSQVLEYEDLCQVDHKSDILILDTYHIPIDHHFIAQQNWKLVLSISDKFTPRYECDIELRPGLTRVNQRQIAPVVLSGPEHILIRKGIEKSRRKESSTNPLKVLVVGGGSDPFGFVPAILEVVSSMNLDIEVHAFTNEVIRKEGKVNFLRHTIGADLDLISNDVDLVFSTASTSSLEFLAREIPMGIACAIDNQVDFYEQLGSLGCALQIGGYGSDGKWRLNMRSIRELLESQELREALRRTIDSLVDTRGAVRVMDSLLSLAASQES